jgi:glycosyltransferase involved in cell wall biosynthesis
MENMEVRAIEILQNGVDTESFKHCSTLEKKINNFIFLGRIRREKGIYDLLSAIDIIVNKRCIKDLCLYIAGDGEIESVKAFVNRHHLQNNVEVLGWLDDEGKIECLKKGETVVLPSYSEGLPISILEGMAAGKIIISTNVGSIPALVTNGENGFLINPGDINKLVDCIVGIIHQESHVERFSVNNINKIGNFYHISQFDERLSIIYEELLK